MKRLYGYVKHFPHAAVCICMDIADYSEIVHESHELLHSIYDNIEEELPLDKPTQLGEQKLSKHTHSLMPTFIMI